jgi:multiple antibiotic resistance protein
MAAFLSNVSVMLVLLNPFALSVYLVDVLHERPIGVLFGILRRAALIAFAVFVVFAWGGERIFTGVLGVRFAAFLVFGGIVFLLVGIKLMLSGSSALDTLRGEPEHLAGAIAMPFMVGPGTVSAAVLAGVQLELGYALGAIASSLVLTVLALLGIKFVFDRVRERNARLIQRYVEITGRVSGIVVGTVAVEMLMQGIQTWLKF